MRGGRAFWREPMLWLVVALPLVTIIASMLMIRLSLRDPADASGNSTRRIAQVQMEDLGPEQEAARRGLRARLDADAASGALRIEFEPDAAAPLALALRHPTRADADRRVLLQHDGGQWHARTEPWPATQAWDLQLSDASGTWRLRGRLQPSSSHASLDPQVSR